MPRPVTYGEVPLCPSISLARALRNLQQDETLCDLTLISDNHKQVRVHKAVLAAMSGYIQKRLKNREPCTSFIVTGISVEGIRSLVDFVYGNVYAIHVKNAEELYPMATLFELTLLQKVCEYVNPEVQKLKWTNKIVPVNPIVFSRRPMGPKSAMARKQQMQSEKQNGTRADSPVNSPKEDEAPTVSAAKGKRPAVNSPSMKEPQAKKTKKNGEIVTTEHSQTDRQNEKSDARFSVKAEINKQNDPKLQMKLEIRLERVNPEKYKSTKQPQPDPRTTPTRLSADAKASVEPDEVVDNGVSDHESDDEEVESADRKARKSSPPKHETKSSPEKQATKSSPGKEKMETDEIDAVMIIEDEDDDSCSKDNDSKMLTPKRKPKAANSSPSPSKRSSKNSSPVQETQFECGKCNNLFNSLQECNTHMVTDHGVTMVSIDENFICSIAGCNFKCDKAESLKKHVVAEHQESLKKSTSSGIGDTEIRIKDELENHSNPEHSRKNGERELSKLNGKDNDDEPEIDTNTGELRVTNKPGPKSSKSRQRTFLAGMPKVALASPPLRTETKIVDGQKMTITYVDNRTVRIEDNTLLEDWCKLLVARRDFSKYDLYVQSPDGKRHRSLKDLHDYLDKYQIEMETDHISFKTTNLMAEAGIPNPSGDKTTPRRRSKPGPKSSKKNTKPELSDNEMVVDEDSDDDKSGPAKRDEADDEDKENSESGENDIEQQGKKGNNSNNFVHRVDVHSY